MRLFEEVQTRTRELQLVPRVSDCDKSTCSTSSAGRRAICSPCSTRSLRRPHACARLYDAFITLKEGNDLKIAAHAFVHPRRLWQIVADSRVGDGACDCGPQARPCGRFRRHPRTSTRTGTRWPAVGSSYYSRQFLSFAMESLSASSLIRRREVHPFSEKQIDLASDLRRSGRHSDRERPAFRRGTGAHAGARAARSRSCGHLARSAMR